MGQMKRPGTQDREPRRSKQNGTGPNAKSTRPRGKAKQAREASMTRHAMSSDGREMKQNGSGRAVGGRKAHA